MNKEQFEKAKNKIIQVERQRNGIGTLAEKTIHAVLKNYMEPNEDFHEVPVNGYVADIFREGHIIEIQTANFNKLRDKLNTFLNEYEVTVVYPIVHTKWLQWIDEDTGIISNKRKSPKTGSVYDAFFELYKIKSYLKNENLKFKFVLLDVEESRLLNGWSTNRKRGSSRFDRIPVNLVNEIDILEIEDFMQLVPIDIPEIFNAKQYAKAAKISVDMARTALNVLTFTQTVKRVGKQGNTILYKV